MKKEKTVKTYQRRTKSGKVVTVRQHTAKYDASDPKAKGKSGAGDEFKALQGKWNDLISNMSDEELHKALMNDGVFDAEWPELPNLDKYIKEGTHKMSTKVRKDIGKMLSLYGKDSLGDAKEHYSSFPGVTSEQKKKLESLGLRRKNNVWTTSNGTYRLYTQKGVSDFLNKFGHLSSREISSLPKSKLVSRREGTPYDEEGVNRVLDRAKERIAKGITAEDDVPVNRNGLVPRRRGYGDRWRRKNRI